VLEVEEEVLVLTVAVESPTRAEEVVVLLMAHSQ
jgi:hypothetical protein